MKTSFADSDVEAAAGGGCNFSVCGIDDYFVVVVDPQVSVLVEVL